MDAQLLAHAGASHATNAATTTHNFAIAATFASLLLR